MNNIKNCIPNCFWWSALIVVLVFPLFMYFYQFSENGLSKDTEEWARFGDYIGGIYSGIIALVAIFITYSLEKSRSKSNILHKRAEALFSTILHMKKRNFTNNDCTALQEQIGVAKLDLPQLLVDKLTSLADNYLLYLYQHEKVDDVLEDSILEELKSIYHG